MFVRIYVIVAVINIFWISCVFSGLETNLSKCCQKHKYRTIDGFKTSATFGRLLPSNYADKTCKPTGGKCGKPLPSARDVSLLLFQNKDTEDPIWTLLFMQWGQFISHDLSLATGRPSVQCCKDGQETEAARTSKRCFNIKLNERDPKNITCTNFVRTLTDDHCEQINSVTSSLDLSQVYGSSEEEVENVREGKSGRLRESKGRHLPLAANTTESCGESCPQGSCFVAGDVRANQNPQLTLLHTILLREHNRVAGILEKLNPHWNGEKIFQETRKYLIGVYQKIVYYDWLPILLGRDYCVKNKLIYSKAGYVDDCEDIKTVIYNEYATAAARILHSLIAGEIKKLDEHRSLTGSIRLKDNFNCPSNVTKEKDICELTIGLVSQQQMKNDPNHVDDITQHLFGFNDLKAIDIQRGRDHGLASYNTVRQSCGLPKAKSFDDFTDYIPKKLIALLNQLYECPDDVDLIVGMQLEKWEDRSLVGPTAQCVIRKQFSNIRKSDSFWFENECVFSSEQLQEIRKANVASILCENVCDGNMSIQPNSFKDPSDSKNEITACKNIAKPDLSKWKEIRTTLIKNSQ